MHHFFLFKSSSHVMFKNCNDAKKLRPDKIIARLWTLLYAYIFLLLLVHCAIYDVKEISTGIHAFSYNPFE